MNEKIKNLVEQCTTVEHGVIQPRSRGDVYHFDQEKFAKLIVQECCDWIDGSPTSESGCQLLLTKSFIIANLKGHFGL
jgi:hypothetical protein